MERYEQITLEGKAVSSPNIALLKYWGKLDIKTKVPLNDSLSLTLDPRKFNSTTQVIASFLEIEESDPETPSPKRVNKDNIQFWVNGKMEEIKPHHISGLEYFIRSLPTQGLEYYQEKGDGGMPQTTIIPKNVLRKAEYVIESRNNFPTAAGMASSASGLSCFILSLANLFNYFKLKEGESSQDYIGRIMDDVIRMDILEKGANPSYKMTKKETQLEQRLVDVLKISCLTRQMSASAARSLYPGLVLTIGPEYLIGGCFGKDLHGVDKKIDQIINLMSKMAFSLPKNTGSKEDDDYLCLALRRFFPTFELGDTPLSKLRRDLHYSCVSIPLKLIIDPAKVEVVERRMGHAVFAFDEEEKKKKSTAGMKISAKTSEFLKPRVNFVNERLKKMINAVVDGDFQTLFYQATRDSNSLHSVCADTLPPIQYLSDKSYDLIALYHELQPLFKAYCYTFDAGPNMHVFYDVQQKGALEDLILRVQGDSGLGDGIKINFGIDI